MSNQTHNIVAQRIKVLGLVQGVGFRPFVYRLAEEFQLTGWVSNSTDGVDIKIEGPENSVMNFLPELRARAPRASQIEHIETTNDAVENLIEFSVLSSSDSTNETSEISPDIAVCTDCLEDMKQQEHRLDYPFINCTNCGPRFTIIRDLPYDRVSTTMAPFEMCPDCRKEYENIHDRRFHAQPVACNRCGPRYTLHLEDRRLDNQHEILDAAARLLTQDKIIAVKGMGGYHLMCNAERDQAVNKLRSAKQREGKPFAVMFRDLDALKKWAHVSEVEENELTSWQRPILILDVMKPLASGVSMEMNTIGAFLPYMPFHYLLFERMKQSALVLTSGNVSDEPIVIDDLEAMNVLGNIADAVLTYNRAIQNRTDDSVVRVMHEKPRMIRRSRGFVPVPVRLPFQVDGFLAAGAELVNCFCIGKGNRAYLSQHIGDLKNIETFEFYTESVDRFKKSFRIHPEVAVADMHPDYLSTRYASGLGIQVVRVQHHHAHIASCMAENGLDEPVIGVALDGTGYGTDGHTWGSEFFICDLKDFRRMNHFEYMDLPGGDKAAEEPWRMGISLLYHAFGEDLHNLNLPVMKETGMDRIRMLTQAMDKKINCPQSSGAGRLFDGVSAIAGVCIHALHHAEAPMRLESVITRGIETTYDIEPTTPVSFAPVIRQIVQDVHEKIPQGVISAKFHNTIADVVLKVIQNISAESAIRKVVLSGGTFQNKYLTERLESLLAQNGFMPFTHSKIPCNDGGIALGQIAIAGKKLCE